MKGAGIVASLIVASATGIGADTLDFSGEAGFEARWFPQSPLFEGQRSSTAGLVIEPSLYGEIAERTSLTVSFLYRYDSADSHRTHGDLREAFLMRYGDWGDASWEIRVGVGRVFWGVAELNNIVDIVNQLDLVEHPRNRPKLGQPMVHLTLAGTWGTLESFLLPYHRTRTFPGTAGRLRSRFLIDDDALYENSSDSRHVDFAVRYSNSVGLIDFGLSVFDGTSREPSFVVSSEADASPFTQGRLTPYYEQIFQFGLDAQFTTERVLYKLEMVEVGGARNIFSEEESYRAFILGAEHSVYSVFGSAASLTLLGEWHYDDRGSRATSVWANDLFLAGFLSLNDVPGTEFVAGLLGDVDHQYRALNLEFKRRLSSNWSLRIESIVILDSDPMDLTYDGRRDSFLGMGLYANF